MSVTKERLKMILGALWRPVAGLLGLAALVMWSSGVFEYRVAPGIVEHGAGFVLPDGSRTVVAKISRFASPVEVVGSVAAERWVNVSARLPATVMTMTVRAGDVVTNGQVLATLDDRDLREQVAMAESQFNQAEVENRRTLQLFEKGASTEQAKLAAQTGLDTARARLQQMRVLMSYAVLTAPLDGIVTDRRFEPGDLVAPGQTLLSLYDPRDMRFDVPVSVRLLPRFALGQAVSVVLERVSQPIKGTVREIVSDVDPLSRTQKVKIHLEQAGGAILPGTYGRIAIEGDSHEALWVPESAMYRVGQQEFVQVVSEGRVTRRIVRAGTIRDGRIEILSGLGDGEVILVEPVKEG